MKAKDDVVQKLLLLFLCGGAVEEERSGVITNMLGNPPLRSAANYHFLIS